MLAAGGDPAKVVFSGVGKTAGEVEYALTSGIRSFNCESEAELALIDAMAARLGKQASFSIRVNPDVDAVTHPYISTGLSQHKFGIAIAEAPAVYERARQFRHLVAEGVSCHIGSQILDLSPIQEAVDKVLALPTRCASRATRFATSIWAAASASPTGPPRSLRRSPISCADCATASRPAASP